MRQLLKKSFTTLSVTVALSLVAHAAPDEKNSVTITRNAASGVQVSETLVKKHFSSETSEGKIR